MKTASDEGFVVLHQVILGERRVAWGNAKEIVIGGKPYLTRRERLLQPGDIEGRSPYHTGRGLGYLPLSVQPSVVSEILLPFKE